MKQLSARLISILISAGISVAALAIAGCFVCVAAYTYLGKQISAPLAALCVAAAALIIALIALAVAKATARSLTDQFRPHPGNGGGTNMGVELGQIFGSHLMAEIRKNPKTTLCMTIAGGLALGLSGRLRRQIFRFFFR